MPSDEQLDLQTAADELGVHYQTAYRWVRSGKLPARVVGGRYQVDRSALTAVESARISPARSGATVAPPHGGCGRTGAHGARRRRRSSSESGGDDARRGGRAHRRGDPAGHRAAAGDHRIGLARRPADDLGRAPGIGDRRADSRWTGPESAWAPTRHGDGGGRQRRLPLAADLDGGGRPARRQLVRRAPRREHAAGRSCCGSAPSTTSTWPCCRPRTPTPPRWLRTPPNGCGQLAPPWCSVDQGRASTT